MTVKKPEPMLDMSDPPRRASQADPWGVRRAEVLLTSLTGVLSARVVVAADGEITEIHCLTEAGLTAKQVVRNIESALLAQLGIKVDHRKISVAQTAEVLPMEQLEEVALVSGTKHRGVLFQKLEVSSDRSHRVRITVTLEHGGDEIISEETCADDHGQRLHAAARATSAALDQVVTECTIDLVGAKAVSAFDREFVLVGVNILTGRDSLLHTGTAEVRRGPEHAAALAVLDATNRWMITHL